LFNEMLSKTKIKFRSTRKGKNELKETLALSLKHKPWLNVAKVLSGPTRGFSSVNLDQIDKKTKAGDTVLILGRILSLGNLTKKIRICALGISEGAKNKLKGTKSEYLTIAEEIKKNPKAEGLVLLK
jgi:ribosomal protein L18E